MAQRPEDEIMADFIPLDSGDPSQHMETQESSARAHFQSIHPEFEMYDHKCVCGRYFKELKNMRTHQKATGHGACVCGENFSSYPELRRHRYEAVHFVRCTCDKIFGSTQHLLSHQRLEEHAGYRDTKKGPLKMSATESDTLNEVLCPCGNQLLEQGGEEPLQCECGRVFQDEWGPARDSYDPATTVFSCCNCRRTYDTWDEMWQHQLYIHHPCIACHKIFICEARLMRHQRATNHCYCADCDEHFMTPDRLRQHLLETHHVDRATVFQDSADERPLHLPATTFSSHRRHQHHYHEHPIYKGGFKSGRNFLHLQLRCRVCGADFTSPKTLHDHRTRGRHDPFASVACPFPAAACDKAAHRFASVSGLLHHLEAAQCGSGIRLADLNDALRGGALERFVRDEYAFKPTPRNPCDALSDGEILALCEAQVRQQRHLFQLCYEHAFPHARAWTIYWTFMAVQIVFYLFMPGVYSKGQPLPHLGGAQLEYYCSAVWSFYTSIVLGLALHYTGIFKLYTLIDEFGPIMTVAILSGYLMSFYFYISAHIRGATVRMTGYPVYDFFMGAELNPRLFGWLDWKMFFEVRMPWFILFFLTLGTAARQYENYGYVSGEVCFLLMAHWLYANACSKGEEMIVTTWDMYFEKLGFMLTFWNLAGVPLSYCHCTLYLANHDPAEYAHPKWLLAILFPAYLFVYWVWDTANSQKNHFRRKERGADYDRKTFPVLPWREVHNPKTIRTNTGKDLLADGWYGLARKIHYTCDLYFALNWGFITGFKSPFPWFYPVFFSCMIVHRAARDIQRCRQQYGEAWKEYERQVPYLFIPYVI